MHPTTHHRANRIPRIARPRTSLFRRLHRALNAWHLRWAMRNVNRQISRAMRQGHSVVELLLRRSQIRAELLDLQVAA